MCCGVLLYYGVCFIVYCYMFCYMNCSNMIKIKMRCDRVYRVGGGSELVWILLRSSRVFHWLTRFTPTPNTIKTRGLLHIQVQSRANHYFQLTNDPFIIHSLTGDPGVRLTRRIFANLSLKWFALESLYLKWIFWWIIMKRIHSLESSWPTSHWRDETTSPQCFLVYICKCCLYIGPEIC